MSVAVRARHLLGACALGALALAGCGDADGPLGTPHEGGTVQIPLAPGFHAAAANYTGAPINRVRITARLMPGGSVVGTAVVDVDPDQSQWSVPFEVTLPPGGAATLEVLVELVNVVDGVETTQWSGEITLTGVQPGEPQQVQSPELVPGPPENLNITGVSITGPAGPVEEGTELDLAAAVQGGPANPTVVWSALTPETATVDQDGHVVTLRPGTARFGVLAGTRTDTHEIEVTQRAASVAITPGSQTLAALGAEATFSAQVLDPRGDPVAGDPALTWSVVEGSAVSMQGPGVFRAEQNGQATVRVALDGAADVAATATVTVEQQVAVVVVTPGSTTVDGLGSTAQFSAEAQDANGNAVGDPTFTWSVDNGDVASIDAAGQATANGVGTTGVSAAADGVSGSASLTVTQHVVSVEMSTTRLEIDALGVDEQLTATARDRNGNPMDVELTWMSALPTVATVDQSGLVTSQANGQAIVFVTAPGNARGDVLVQIEQVVTDVVVDPAEHLYEALGATQLFTATPVDRNGTEVQGRIVTWSTSDGGVVAVSDHGDNTATGTAVSNGEARIDATLGSIEGAAAVKVDAPVGAAPALAIEPLDVKGVGNCFPFGGNTNYSFMGFIYRNVPAFTLSPGDKIAFDMGALNFDETRRNIFFAVANKNPGPPQLGSGSNVVSQGIAAQSWHQVVSDAQVPLNPHGNTVIGDYELIYTAEASFAFPGGGFIVGFQNSPPAAYRDSGCEQVLVYGNWDDPSPHFYSRFLQQPDLSLEPLDVPSPSNAMWIGGIRIYRENQAALLMAQPAGPTLEQLRAVRDARPMEAGADGLPAGSGFQRPTLPIRR
ncbi:MAG: Ig-like domain-containing protein [Gemmatimonadota bacterium]